MTAVSRIIGRFQWYIVNRQQLFSPTRFAGRSRGRVVRWLESRGVAQPGSAPALGAGGRWFESSRPDQYFQRNTAARVDRRFATAVNIEDTVSSAVATRSLRQRVAG
jgi:hypothetical protein